MGAPKFSGATGTLTPAFVNSHIWPKPGQIWGTLVRGKEIFHHPMDTKPEFMALLADKFHHGGLNAAGAGIGYG